MLFAAPPWIATHEATCAPLQGLCWLHRSLGFEKGVGRHDSPHVARRADRDRFRSRALSTSSSPFVQPSHLLLPGERGAIARRGWSRRVHPYGGDQAADHEHQHKNRLPGGRRGGRRGRLRGAYQPGPAAGGGARVGVVAAAGRGSWDEASMEPAQGAPQHCERGVGGFAAPLAARMLRRTHRRGSSLLTEDGVLPIDGAAPDRSMRTGGEVEGC